MKRCGFTSLRLPAGTGRKRYTVYMPADDVLTVRELGDERKQSYNSILVQALELGLNMLRRSEPARRKS